jgi:hypothetical protein
MAVRLSSSHGGRPLPPRKIPGIHFCWRPSRPQGHSSVGKIRSIEKSSDLIVNRIRHIPLCSIVASTKYATTYIFFFNLCGGTSGSAATTGLLCQLRVIMKMIVEKQMKCRLAGETEVLGEYLPQRHFCPSQNPT